MNGLLPKSIKSGTSLEQGFQGSVAKSKNYSDSCLGGYVLIFQGSQYGECCCYTSASTWEKVLYGKCNRVFLKVLDWNLRSPHCIATLMIKEKYGAYPEKKEPYS